VTGLRGRTAIAGGALIMMAGLVIPAATATTATAATTPVQGVDVSSVQHSSSPTITWADVASAGKSFVGIKASEGDYYTNPYFAGDPSKGYESDVQQAVGQQLYVIPYAFANPFDPAANGTAIQQADTAATAVNSVKAYANYMLPLAIDLESDPYAANDNTNQCYGLSTSAMVTWIKGFITEYDSKLPEARPLIIYTTADWWDTCTGSSTAFTSDPLWLASYGVSNPALPAGWHNYTFWQYSAGGSVSGITGATDLDYLGPVLEASQVSKAIGSVQLRTLQWLNSPSTSVTYSVTSGALPTGLTLSMSGSTAGLISGTPTAIGQYSVTVTPSVGAAMPINWYVHGTLTVNSPGNRTGTAGTPVWLRVAASDTDTGYTPSFAASGLPPGLSITSGGVISGWPYKAGTYHVTVAASDGLYASGSTMFTWTVNAAPDSGATGAIKQWGGSGKCLDDSGSKTTNGAAVDLWSCTGKAGQSWTMPQDGTVRVLGKCLDAVGEGKTNGTKLQLWACNSGDGAQQWLVGTNSELINPQSGKCLDVPSTNAPNGTRPELYTCPAPTANVASFHWLRPAANVYSGNAGKCLAASGTTAVLANCANTSAQHWTESWNGTLQLGTQCLTATSSGGVAIGACSSATKWGLRGVGTLPIGTEIVSPAGQCVTAPSAANGVALKMEACSDTDGATWHAE
jgi:GH25 family lysozyme M1 (1,4-beta-N-acetylmuramidase)